MLGGIAHETHASQNVLGKTVPPGRPSPHGDGHVGSPRLAAFHSAKSLALRFSLVVKSASPSEARAALPTAHGFSLP